jgi:hypothetical protein
MFYIKIEERLIQTLIRLGWHNEAPRANRRPPNLGDDNQFEEKQQQHDPTGHQGGGQEASHCQDLVTEPATDEQGNLRPSTDAPLALQTNDDDQNQTTRQPPSKEHATRTRTTVPPAARPHPPPRCHRPGLRRGS